jgi:hypothetical protein
MTANAFSTLPDFSPRAVPAPVPPCAVRSILADLETMGLRLDAGSPRDALALSAALSAAAARLAQIARNQDVGISSPFTLIEDDAGKLIVMHADRRIGFVMRPDDQCKRWSICIELRIDEKLPAPFEWYLTHFDSRDALKAFLSIA